MAPPMGGISTPSSPFIVFVKMVARSRSPARTSATSLSYRGFASADGCHAGIRHAGTRQTGIRRDGVTRSRTRPDGSKL